MGVPLEGRAFRFNLFARASQKGFTLQSLTRSYNTGGCNMVKSDKITISSLQYWYI